LRYSSDLTDKEWRIIEPFFTRAKKGKHLQKHSKRKLVNAVRYIARTCCQWELLPNDYPNYKTLNSFYVRVRKSELWEEIMDILVEKRVFKPSVQPNLATH